MTPGSSLLYPAIWSYQDGGWVGASPNNMNRKDGLTLSGSWTHVLRLLRESRWPPQEQWPTYGSFRGPYLYPPFPCCNSSCYSPIPFYGKTPCQIFFPPGPGQLSSPLFFASPFFSPISLPFLLSFCFSPSLSLIIYQFLLPLLLPPFLCCLVFHIGSFSALLLPSLFTTVYYRETTSPVSISVLLN